MSTRVRWSRRIPAAVAFLIVGSMMASGARADMITLNFGSVFSGTAPSGAGPWLTATFADVAAGSVRLQITAGGLSGNESIDSVYFNLNPAILPGSLTLARDNASTGPTAANTVISLAANGFRADGDGFYDLLIDLPPPPGSQQARFTAGETLIYLINGPATLSAASFAFLSSPGPGGGPGPQFAAAHIMQIGAAADSGWAGASPAPVPLPAGLLLLASGLGLLGVPRRRVAQPAASAFS